MGAWRPLASVVAIAAFAAPYSSPAEEATTPVFEQEAASQSPEIEGLIRQLGDPDFRKRDDAYAKLKDLGATASPALRLARESTDPEIAGRAEGLIREIERPSASSGWGGMARPWTGRMGVNDGLRMQVRDGAHRVVVRDNLGRTIRINAGPAGIEMSVTDVENGKSVTRNFQARTPEQLKAQNPDAFALYDLWTGQRGVLRVRQRPLPPEPGVMPRNAPIRRPDRAALNADIQRLRRQQRGSAREGGRLIDPREAEQEMLEAFKDIQRRRDADEAGVDPFNIPDAPHRPGPRLGVLILVDSVDGVTVVRVLPGSRAERLRLETFDVIKSVNGKAVNEAADLERVLAETKDPLVIECTRDGSPVKLEEKTELPGKPKG